jgi:hypothetical protein
VGPFACGATFSLNVGQAAPFCRNFAVLHRPSDDDVCCGTMFSAVLALA